MIYMRKFSRGVSLCVIATFFFLGIQASAYASILGTDATLNIEQTSKAHKLLARQDVQDQLVQLGVDPADAIKRVNTMSQQELAALNGKLEKLPAGGELVATLGLIFLILVLTDILGYTDIFPFVKSKK